MTIENRSGIRPWNYCLLVQQDETPRKLGNIILPDESKDKLDGAITRGRIVAMSPLAYDYIADPEIRAKAPGVGAWILFKKYARVEHEGADGKKYWMLQDKEIQAELDPVIWGFAEEARNAA